MKRKGLKKIEANLEIYTGLVVALCRSEQRVSQLSFAKEFKPWNQFIF